MRQADLNKIESLRALLSKCREGCPASVIRDADARLAKLASGAKIAKRAPNAFGKFLQTAFPRLQRAHPGTDAPTIMKLAAEEWNLKKKKKSQPMT